VSVNSEEVAEGRQSLGDPPAAPAEKPDITKLILAVLSPFPHGLTTREVIELTGMTSYNASGKLSKLATSGVIEKFTIAGGYRHRWRVKPGSAAMQSVGPVEKGN